MNNGCEAKVVQAYPGKIDPKTSIKERPTFKIISTFSINDRRKAKSIVDEMQRVIDLDAEPCRVYLHSYGDPIPFYAALGRTNGR